MATTIRESISRVRNVVKAVKEDPFMTDRFIYSLIMKYAKTLIKRETKRENLFKYSTLFREIPCVDLKEVDKVEACCIGIRTGCIFMRSVDKLPTIQDYNGGPLIKSVSSVDYSTKAYKTTPELYTNMTKTSSFKYNKNKYYWIVDGYLYLPNVSWEGVRLQAMFEEDISPYLCSSDDSENSCVVEQDRLMSVPEHLYSEIETAVIQEILTSGQLPPDGADDSQNVLR